MSPKTVSSARVAGLVLEGHKDAAVEVPFDPAERFGVEAVPLRRGRRGHRVRATAKSCRFESEIVPRSKRFWLVLPASVLADLRLEPGERIEVSVEPLGVAVSPKRAARRSSS